MYKTLTPTHPFTSLLANCSGTEKLQALSLALLLPLRQTVKTKNTPQLWRAVDYLNIISLIINSAMF
ncbi:hypothetical protein DC094_01365 [Pelagibaculum spongiae]|uniref:Uncharacterized protein n=1 Tax=Pelagibaculum spongiae TaxID=2080658 RepID=A0A2V1GX83_9GAMM|nr:hypothetical protein DC094_01365 [Pelagibaculum spongiae]